MKLPPAIASAQERRLAPVAGLTTGLVFGSLGASGPVIASFLQSIGLEGSDFALGMSVTYLTMCATQLITFQANGIYRTEVTTLALALLVPTIAGQTMGHLARRFVSATALQRVVLILLLVLGLSIIVTAIGELYL